MGRGVGGCLRGKKLIEHTSVPCVFPGIAARDVAGGLRSLAQAARGVAALTSDPAVQAIVLDTASDVLDKASSLIEEAKKASGHPGDPESQQRLAQVAKAVTQALNRCVSCLPGQRDVDNALRAVGDASKRLLSDSVGGLGMADGGLCIWAHPLTLPSQICAFSLSQALHHSPAFPS